MNLKTILTATILASTTIAASAQGPLFGVKGGLNYSTLAVDQADDETSRTGYNFGVFGRTNTEETFGLQVELLYSTKGSTSNYSTLFGLVEQEVDLNLNYIELPVLVSFRVAEIVDFQLGVYAGYLVSANAKSSGDLGSGSDELDRDNFKSMDFGIGGGVAFNAGSNIQLGVRYLHGMSTVADSDAAEFVLDDAKNRVAQLYIGFGIGGS